MISESSLCPCYSKLLYKDCCQKFHQGTPCENALQLMRSRYSGYALSLVDYIIHTTHPSNKEYSEDIATWKQHILHFCKHTTFENLEISDFTESQDTAYVTFTAHLSQNGQSATFTEKSRFKKVDGRWLYLDGTVY